MVLTSTDGLGNTTTMTYDAGDRMTSQTDPLGNVTSWTYNNNDDVTSRTDPYPAGDDPADHTVHFTYSNDKRFSLLSETNKAGGTIHRGYSSTGDLVQVADDEGNDVFTMVRRNDGKVSSKTDRFGTKTFDYNPGVSQPTHVVDGHGVETFFDYDDNNRMLRMLRNGILANFTYDAVGRELRRDYGNGVTVDFEYTVGVAEWTRISGPTFGTVSRTFSKTGRVVGWTMPNGDTFSRAFDGAGRLAESTDALGNRSVNFYDQAGRLESTTREVDSATTSYTRDAAGRILMAGMPTPNSALRRRHPR